MNLVIHSRQTIRENFIQENRGFEFLAPLVRDMVQTDPTKLPYMKEVVVRFDKLRLSLSKWLKIRSRVVDNDEDRFERITCTVLHWIRRITLVARGVVDVPPRDLDTFVSMYVQSESL
ncbi:hypothetical protein HD554DRAFT_2071501 [Boletus coccyginus]|nr:hypothetical protein HD554DRAFT_2071501 [Boletus coccyginus]